MLISTLNRLCLFLACLIPASVAYGFEYKYAGNVLVVNERGAWVRDGKASIALVPSFNKGLKDGMAKGRYKKVRKQAILVSLVGPYASFRVLMSALPVDAQVSAVVRPQGYVYMRVIDIRHPRQPDTPVSLTDIFSELEVKNALASSTDEDLRQAYQRSDKSFGLNAFNMAGLPSDGDFLYEFAFGEVSSDDVDIKVQVHTPGFGDGLDGDVFYTLRFKQSDKIRGWLVDANSKARGYLSGNSMGGGVRPSFRFR